MPGALDGIRVLDFTVPQQRLVERMRFVQRGGYAFLRAKKVMVRVRRSSRL